MLLMFIRKYGSWDAHSVLKKRINPLILRHLQHASAVGAGFIPVLLTAVKIQNRYHAAARTGINPYGGCVQHIDYQNVANVTYVCVHYHFAGRPLWPSGRSKDRISVASVCFEGFPLCQHQDPTEEDLPFGV